MAFKIRGPTKFERVGLAIMAVSGALMWIVANGIFTKGFADKNSWLSGVQTPAISLFWILVAIYHIGLFVIAGRSIIVNEKNTAADAIAMGIGIIGVIFIITSVVGFYYFQTGNIDWFFGINQQTLFFTGMILEALTILYYASTE